MVAALAWRLVAVCALACVLAASAQPVVTCGNCDLRKDEKGLAGCELVLSNQALFPSGPSGLNIHGYSGASLHSVCTRCPEGQTACNNPKGGFAPCQFLNNNTDSRNCGACGNVCKDDRPICNDGQCTCTNSTLGVCGRDSFCNLNIPPEEGTSQCQKCPDTLANCNPATDLGVERDCETDLHNDADNCGICGNECASGEVCISGVCSCGTESRKPCPANKVCIGGACRDCTGTTDERCKKVSWFDASGYCSGNDCLECPGGFADCTNNNINGDPDNGSPDDCETRINGRGSSQNCGACGAACDGEGVSCCDGACKCGAFANHTAPTDDECAVAVQCSENEYCDDTLKVCLPLNRGLAKCARNARSQNEGTTLNSAPFCGTCNRTVAAEEFIINGTCLASSSSHCGKEGVECAPNQQCIRGKCECNIGGSPWFTWEPYLSRDRDRDNKQRQWLNYVPKNCRGDYVQNQLLGRYAVASNALFALQGCINLALPEVDRITPADLKNDTFIDLSCPGTKDKCTRAFCKEAVHNLTSRHRKPFCGTMHWATKHLKWCAQKTEAYGEKSDITCSNMVARDFLDGTREMFNLYSFLGCDERHDDMELLFGAEIANRRHQYAYEAAYKLLGAASPLKLSLAVIIGTVMSSIFVLFGM